MKKAIPVFLAVVLLVACSREEVSKTTSATPNARNAPDDITAPLGKPDNPQERERERFDERWRQLQSFAAQQQAQQAQARQAAAAAAAQPPANFRFVSGQKETFKGLDANAINNAPVNVPVTGDVKGPSVLRAQVYLDRVHFSVGSIDGRWGRNSGITVWWYQRARGMQPTGDMDQATFQRLAGEAGYAPVVVPYTITQDDTDYHFSKIPDDVYEKAKLSHLNYQSLREMLAERFHSTEDFLEVLNPDVKFSEARAGQQIIVPNVRPPMAADHPDVARIIISIAGNSFNAFDANGNIVFHGPSTLGSGYDPSPTETLHIVKVSQNPDFHYDPTLYHEVPDSMPDAHLPSGPNCPVGVVWMALSKQHYGIHGTDDPDSIGYASSHGCVRLTNWDAEEVSHRVQPGVTVSFVDTRSEGLPAVAKKD